MPWEQPGRVYRSLRSAKKLKQREVAELLGVEQAWISQIENERTKIPSGWTDDDDLRVLEGDDPGWVDDRPVDRTLWDEALALGAPEPVETRPCYTIGLLVTDGLPRIPDPLLVVLDRDAVDTVAEELAREGVVGVAVVPMWSGWIWEHGGTVTEPERLGRAARAMFDE